jgi:two-component system phosphate regulon sensor histidine kinase PhoR
MIKRFGLGFIELFVINVIVGFIVTEVLIGHQLTGSQLRGLLLLNLLVAAGELAVVSWLFRHRQQPVISMTNKVEGMLHDKEPAHILLRTDDDYYELAMAINRLQTHQQKLLREMNQQTEELRLLLAYLPIGVMVIDRYRNVEMANAAMAEFLQTEISPRRHPYSQDIHQFELISLIGEVINDKQSRRRVMTLTNVPTDKKVEASVVYTSTTEDFFQILVLLYDVTEIYAVEKMQMDFISNASHELKTPVTAISGFAETLLAGAKDDPETLTEFLGIIQRESRRLTELIQDVLAISRIESQSVSTQNRTQVDVAALVTEQENVMQQLAAMKQLRVIDQVPATAQQYTDEKKLTQIVKNLLSNAIKYNREGGSVTVAYQADDTNWSLSVTDTGIGIAQAEQARIFERFYRVDPSRNKQVVSGTGLGLAIVSELVKSLNGQISVTSQRGVGSTFTVQFPVTVAGDAEAVAAN